MSLICVYFCFSFDYHVYLFLAVLEIRSTVRGRGAPEEYRSIPLSSIGCARVVSS